MSEQWGTLATENVSFEDFCKALVNIPAIQACASQNELAVVLDDFYVTRNDSEPHRIDATAHDWARHDPENIRHAYLSLVDAHPGAHIRAHHCDTRGYEIERTYVHTPDTTRDDVAFGEMRSVFARGASAETFERLCELLGDARLGPKVLEYVRAHIATWPKHIERRAPISWIWRHTQWNTCPQFELCNSIRVTQVGHDHMSARTPRADYCHMSVRIVGVPVQAALSSMFPPESNMFGSIDDFRDSHEGTRVIALSSGDTLVTYEHNQTYRWSLQLADLQQLFPNQLLHVYVSNHFGDYAYMSLFEGTRWLYQEDMRSALQLEAHVWDDEDVNSSAFLIAAPPDERSLALLRVVRDRIHAAGTTPADLLMLSGVEEWFDGTLPERGGDLPEREEDILRCIRNDNPPRHTPTSRAELFDPLNDDDIPF